MLENQAAFSTGIALPLNMATLMAKVTLSDVVSTTNHAISSSQRMENVLVSALFNSAPQRLWSQSDEANLSTGCANINVRGRLTPMILSMETSLKVKGNFGQEIFVFDVAEHG